MWLVFMNLTPEPGFSAQPAINLQHCTASSLVSISFSGNLYKWETSPRDLQRSPQLKNSQANRCSREMLSPEKLEKSKIFVFPVYFPKVPILQYCNLFGICGIYVIDLCTRFVWSMWRICYVLWISCSFIKVRQQNFKQGRPRRTEGEQWEWL